MVRPRNSYVHATLSRIKRLCLYVYSFYVCVTTMVKEETMNLGWVTHGKGRWERREGEMMSLYLN